MLNELDKISALCVHPCYDEKACNKFARMHIPVAPSCNIQCNYCNRKFDCCNESRPGVTSEILSPEIAIKKIRIVKEKLPNLRVVGIAGPGDPLANESTFDTLDKISKEFPDMILCISTNGLELPGSVNRLYDLGVRFVTVTVNSCNPDIGAKIYDSVSTDGIKYTGTKGAKILIDRQIDGIKKCVSIGITVKVNIVMIPGINDDIPNTIDTIRSLGVYTVNILPLIPISGTKFCNLRAPTSMERKKIMDMYSTKIKMMRHCRQCRADAIGLIGKDIHKEFINVINPTPGHNILLPHINNTSDNIPNGHHIIAVSTTDGIHIDSGFGNTNKFMIYHTNGISYKLID